jgi:hypothetical protein
MGYLILSVNLLNVKLKLNFSFQFQHGVHGANLVIKIPENLSSDNSTYRLDYIPAHGHPPPNTTYVSRDIKDNIEFSEGLPGTKYDFYLYYTNSTVHDWLTWTASITTREFSVHQFYSECSKSLRTPFFKVGSPSIHPWWAIEKGYLSATLQHQICTYVICLIFSLLLFLI